MMIKKISVAVLVCLSQMTCPVIHKSSYPYIAGDTVMAFCTFVLAEGRTFDPVQVKTADTICVQTDLLPKFFKEFCPSIKNPFILVTHNDGYASDDPMPGPYRGQLDDPLLIAWFTQNVDIAHHPKLFALPIGLANHYWPHGRTEVFDRYIKLYRNRERDKLLYLNFKILTHEKERRLVYDLFAKKSYCTARVAIYGSNIPDPNLSLEQYLNDISHHKFVLSPRGHGLDCHRTWEALLMGSIPIVCTSTLDVLYEDLPVLIIHDWNEVTEDFLNQKYAEMTKKKYRFEKLYAPYWFAKIKEVQKRYRETVL